LLEVSTHPGGDAGTNRKTDGGGVEIDRGKGVKKKKTESKHNNQPVNSLVVTAGLKSRGNTT